MVGGRKSLVDWPDGEIVDDLCHAGNSAHDRFDLLPFLNGRHRADQRDERLSDDKMHWTKGGADPERGDLRLNCCPNLDQQRLIGCCKRQVPERGVREPVRHAGKVCAKNPVGPSRLRRWGQAALIGRKTHERPKFIGP